MARVILLMPLDTVASLTNCSLGIMHALTRQGIAVSFFKPIAQTIHSNDKTIDSPVIDRTAQILHTYTTLQAPPSFSLYYAEQLISQGKSDELLEQIMVRFANYHHQAAAVIIVEGFVPTSVYSYPHEFNVRLAQALNAELVLVSSPSEADLPQFHERLERVTASFSTINQPAIAGILINKLDAFSGKIPPILTLIPQSAEDSLSSTSDGFTQKPVNLPYRLLGYIPWDREIMACRAADVARQLTATILNPGEMQQRRLKSITFCAHSIPHMLNHFQPGALLVTSADRADVILAAALSSLNGITLGALLLTGGYTLEKSIQQICWRAFEAGLPVFSVNTHTWQTAMDLQRLNLEAPIDDWQRLEATQEYVANQLNPEWIHSLTTTNHHSPILSPPAFRYRLTELARQANRCIILPEGDEPRTIRAAVLCSNRQIARCILLGNPLTIHRAAEAEGILLTEDVEIWDPQPLRADYLPRLLALRGHRGLTELAAHEWIQDNVVLATLMLEQGRVDGLVSGAVHTTANTIRPALQLIRTVPQVSLVSSIFFMLLPDQVLVYGDCAINPDPTAEQLATIAIQSADSAAALGITPKVAMISYSTGDSGSGVDVDKVRLATQMAQQQRPDLLIDGPLQYDAAVTQTVAKTKAPLSSVAGQATVLIFPDLNTGNTTYKAVQRSANVVSIGPMLQGLRKPVNDLSRGALVDDIIYTIALTAIQAAQPS